MCEGEEEKRKLTLKITNKQVSEMMRNILAATQSDCFEF